MLTHSFSVVALISSTTAYTIQTDNAAFESILGPHPKIVELASSDINLFHEAGVYHPLTKALWTVSDMVPNTTNRYISRITDLQSAKGLEIERINTTIPIPIGGHRYVQNTSFGDVIMFVAQGTKAESPPGGVYALNPYPPYNTSLVVGSYGDYPFNSPDEITVTSDGVIWLTDPVYGYGEGNRNLPLLPNQVYAYNPATSDIRVVADGFGRPNGLAFSPDGLTAYIGDTGASIGNTTLDTQGPRTIYAYDRQGKFLINRHVFAMPKTLYGAADGIKTDSRGNVWAGVNGYGVNVWDREGVLLGGFELSTDVGNLGFGEAGEVFVLAGKKLFKLVVSQQVIGVL